MEETSMKLPIDTRFIQGSSACEEHRNNPVSNVENQITDEDYLIERKKFAEESFENVELVLQKSVSVEQNSVSNDDFPHTDGDSVKTMQASYLSKIAGSSSYLLPSNDLTILEGCDGQCSPLVMRKGDNLTLTANENVPEEPDLLIGKVRIVSEKEELQIGGKPKENKVSDAKCEGMDNSSGYLSQCVLNSGLEGVVESFVDASENCNELIHSVDEGDSENNSKTCISSKSCDERSLNHMRYLISNLPDLAKYFKLHKKIGAGTFSSVFMASLKHNVTERFPDLKGRKFAIKHLIPTLLPKRVARELKYLHQIGGKDNVIGVDLSLRNGDCVVFIMPYIPHNRFSEYVLDMNVAETREYMRNLLIALRRVHSFNVIHRDVKPSNFLYDRESKRYLLVDFGLSQSIHPRLKSTADERGSKRKRQEDNFTENGKIRLTENKPSIFDSISKKVVLQPQRQEENFGHDFSQTVKRFKLYDQCSRGQKMIEQLHKQKINENKRAPLTTKVPNQQNITTPQNVTLPFSSSKVTNQDAGIKKKLFASNNENELPKLHRFGEAVKSTSLANHQSTSIFPSHNLDPSINRLGSLHESESKHKFQNLMPIMGRDGKHSGSTVVRVQNSQVKSQMLKPLSPLESEQQRKIMFTRHRTNVRPHLLKGPKCFCKGLPQVCAICMKFPPIPAPRAGTPGFRPPEVLLRYPMQTTAVDMWAAGVIMLCILSGCYPFFRSRDDITGLAEIMTIFGTERIKEVAKSLGRIVQCSNDKPPLDLRKLCERLRRRRKERVNGVPDNINTLPVCPKCENTIEIELEGCLCLSPDIGLKLGEFPPSAYDLLYKLLDLNPATRITAEQALQHPFLNQDI